MADYRGPTSKSPTTNLEAALALAAAGYSIYPSPTKNGAARVKWRAQSTTDPATITKWWTKWPHDLICLDCGKSGIAVIDADSIKGHGVDGHANLAALEFDNETLPETLMAETPSTGVHYIFDDPFGQMKSTAGVLAPGVDTRGVGGMIVLAPSHVVGKGAYKWLNDLPRAETPDWVIKLAGVVNSHGPVPDAEFEPAYTDEEFAERIKLIPVEQFDGKHDEWLSIMLACTHSSTVANGKAAFIDWTTKSGAGMYASEADAIEARWDYNYRNRNAGGKAAKVGTFNKYLTDAGHPELVKHSASDDNSAADDFADTVEEDQPQADAAPDFAAERDKAKRRIMSLRRKAGTKGCTPENAEKYLAEIGELMAKFDIKDDDLKKKRPPSDATLADFVAYLPEKKYMYVPTRALWPPTTVNSLFGKNAASDLDRTNPTHVMGWAPGHDAIIKGRLMITEGGWIEKENANTLNLYRPPPTIKPGNAILAKPWVEHVKYLFPDDWRHLMKWMAHRVRYLGVKVNHALIVGSEDQGIGKDTIFQPLVAILGEWNCQEVTAKQSMNPDFNPFLQSMLCRISEANDLGDDDKFSFYTRRKAWMVSPPDFIGVADKHVKLHPVMNLVAMIISTNDKAGLYLEPGDRRHYVAWSNIKRSDPRFASGEYFKEMFAWYAAGGVGHVLAYLNKVDLSGFDPKAPPPPTSAYWDIINSGQSSEASDLADLIDHIDLIDGADAITVPMLVRYAEAAKEGFEDALSLLTDSKSRKIIPHRLNRAGYVPVRNELDKIGGRWRIEKERAVVYSRKEWNEKQRLDAVRKLVRG